MGGHRVSDSGIESQTFEMRHESLTECGDNERGNEVLVLLACRRSRVWYRSVSLTGSVGLNVER